MVFSDDGNVNEIQNSTTVVQENQVFINFYILFIL